jgi:hypothetical protein
MAPATAVGYFILIHALSIPPALWRDLITKHVSHFFKCSTSLK